MTAMAAARAMHWCGACVDSFGYGFAGEIALVDGELIASDAARYMEEHGQSHCIELRAARLRHLAHHIAVLARHSVRPHLVDFLDGDVDLRAQPGLETAHGWVLRVASSRRAAQTSSTRVRSRLSWMILKLRTCGSSRTM